MGKGKHHWKEYTIDEMLEMLQEVGFHLHYIKVERIQAYNLRHFGIRPLIRKARDLMFGQCMFIEAQKVIA